MGLASTQEPFLAQLDLLPAKRHSNTTQKLLKEALFYIVFVPWASGVMTEFEYELYSKSLPDDEFNQKWWELKKKYQGIIPLSPRGEEFCDALSKTHLVDDAAQYYDYSLSFILLFQFHNYISKNILNQDPHTTNYYGNKSVGDFLRQIMYYGACKNWRKVLIENIGEDISARSMIDYFEPLMDFLKKENKGRKYVLPEYIN